MSSSRPKRKGAREEQSEAVHSLKNGLTPADLISVSFSFVVVVPRTKYPSVTSCFASGRPNHQQPKTPIDLMFFSFI